jgi:hypothetical protein
MDLDPDALDASIDQAVDALFIDRVEARRAGSFPTGGEPGQDPAEDDRASPEEDILHHVKQHLLALDWEISPANIEALNASLHDLKAEQGADGDVCRVLGRMEVLCETLSTAGPEVRPEAVQFLHATTRALHLMLQTDTSAEQRGTVAAKVESDFQNLGPVIPKECLETIQGQRSHRIASSPEPSDPDEEEEFPLLTPEEVLGVTPASVPMAAEQGLESSELLPLLEPEPATADAPPASSDGWMVPQTAVAPQPGFGELDFVSADSTSVVREAVGPDELPTDSEAPDPRVVLPEESRVGAEEGPPPDCPTTDSRPACACDSTVGAEQDARLLAVLESSGRLQTELDRTNREVGAFFGRVLRATEGKPHLERLARSFSNARDAVAQRLAATEEAACDLHAQLSRVAQDEGPLDRLEGAPIGGCPLGDDAREIVGAAGQIQEAVAMLQQTLAVLMSQPTSASAAAEVFPAAVGGVGTPLHHGSVGGTT